MTAHFMDIGAIADIPRDGARIVETGGGRVAVFRTSDDRLFALSDRCPHLAGPLSQGIVHGAKVTCPLHNLVIDLETGSAADPEEGCVSTYRVEAKDGRVLLDVRQLMRRGAA